MKLLLLLGCVGTLVTCVTRQYNAAGARQSNQRRVAVIRYAHVHSPAQVIRDLEALKANGYQFLTMQDYADTLSAHRAPSSEKEVLVTIDKSDAVLKTIHTALVKSGIQIAAFIQSEPSERNRLSSDSLKQMKNAGRIEIFLRSADGMKINSAGDSELVQKQIVEPALKLREELGDEPLVRREPLLAMAIGGNYGQVEVDAISENYQLAFGDGSLNTMHDLPRFSVPLDTTQLDCHIQNWKKSLPLCSENTTISDFPNPNSNPNPIPNPIVDDKPLSNKPTFGNLHFPVVLTYHDIIDTSTGERLTTSDVSATDFVAHLNWLQKNNFQTVSLDDLYQFKRHNKPLPVQPGKVPLVITFDDGYMGPFTFRNELVKRGMHAAFFAHVGSVGVKSFNPHMTWDDLRQLEVEGNGLFTVQSHSWTHPALDETSPDDLQMEIVRSRKRIIEQLDAGLIESVDSRPYFAYPMGRYDSLVLDIVKQNYKMAFAVGAPKLGRMPIYEIPRVEIAFARNGPVERFAAAVRSWQNH